MTLDHSPADIIRYLLIANRLASLPENNTSWPAHVSSEPDAPDNCITLYDTESVLDGRLHFTGDMVEFFGVQIRVRSESEYLVGYNKAKAIHTALQSILREEVTIGAATHEVQTITMVSDVIALGQERGISDRQLFTINLLVTMNY